MGDDAVSVADDQWVLRKIVKGPGYYSAEKCPPIELGAFRPNKRDLDGLSFYLESEMAIEALIKTAAPRPASELVVIRLLAKDIYDLGLTLKKTVDSNDLPGHLVIPEINIIDYEGSRKRIIKSLIERLVNLALDHVAFNQV
jgi:hypothetical protein